MKRLFSTQSNAHRREDGVSKWYGRLVALAALLIMTGAVNAAPAYKIYDYDFTKFSNANQIVMSNTSFNGGGNLNWDGVKVAETINGIDGSKLAFAYTGGYGSWAAGKWWFDANNSLVNEWIDNTALAIMNLRAGDIVTITCNSSNALQYVKFDGNVHAVFANQHQDFYYREYNTYIESERPIHITSDGNLILKNTENVRISRIYIQSIKNATYSITKVSDNQTTFEFTSDGLMDYNDIAVPYMQVSFGAARNYVVVDNYQSHIYDWQEYEGVFTQTGEVAPFSGNFYTFTPSGNGNVTLTGGYSNYYGGGATVYLYRETTDNHSSFAKVTDQNGNWGNGWNSGNISFNVQAGYTYYICNKDNWGQQFNLQTLTFTNTFYLEPLAVIKDSSNPNGYLTTVHSANNVGINNSGRSYVKRHSENIDVSDLSMSLSNGQLSVSGIAFVDESANKGGTIIYHLDTNEGWADLVITIPYSANWGTDNDEYGSRSWGHMWNFADPRQSDSGRNTTGILELGKASDSNSKLSEEIAKREWNYAQRVTGESGGFHDPMYTNVYDMEGDNADMIWETEGLWFDTESNLSCLWNEGPVPTLKAAAAHYTDYSNNSDPDRYIGLLPGGNSSFTIPGLKDGDRVEIFLGSGEGSGTDVPIFEITGAKDALGKAIDSDYRVGGSMWRPSGSNYNYRSCYQFIKDGDGNMKFSLKDGSMAKLYSIRIYRGDKSYRNHVERDGNTPGYQILNTYKDGAKGENGKAYTYTLHHRGKGEVLFDPVVLASEGNLDMTSSGLFRSNDRLYITYKSKIGQYGTFRLRIKGSDYTGDYVTDYADQSLSVGYLEKMQYPYTWDFTDLKTEYVDKDYASGIAQELSSDSQNNKINIWTTDVNGYGFTVQNNGVVSNVRDDQVFTSGAQLYAGNKMFAETAGLGVETSHGRAINSKMVLSSTGLIVSTNRNSEFVLRIPEVEGGAAVYVRAKKLAQNGNRPYLEKCLLGSAAQADFGNTVEVGNDDNEYVFVVKNNSDDVQDVRIKLNNYEIRRIAVSIDPKKVNVKGYASESRDHAIDASLLPYFTGEDMRTYLVSEEPDYGKATVALTDMAQTANYVIPAGTGCIIRRVVDESEGAVSDKTFDVLTSGEGFHLFVPDMHDNERGEGKYADATANNQWLVPVVAGMENGVPYTNNKYVTLNHSGYDDSGAVWYAWTWSTADDGAWVPEFDGKFIGLKSKAVFVRMKPEVQNGVPTWDYKWNQTSDITIEEGAAYQISGWNNDNGNMGCSKVGTVNPSVDMTNYVLTYQYKKLNPDGSLSSQVYSGEEKFYRVHSGWNVKLRANSAYLQVPTEEVAPNGVNTTTRAHSFTFLFDGEEQQATAIDDLNVDELLEGEEQLSGDNAEWYNLNGQKLNGRPAHRGLYIVNGKKVLVK